jgi:hypothetical protein
MSSTPITLEDVIDSHAPGLLTTLDTSVTIVVSDFVRQGDVIVIPERMATPAVEAVAAVPREGVALVRSEFGGHTHLLVAEGDVRYTAVPPTWPQTEDEIIEVGALAVGEGATAFLIHPEHGAVGLRPGRYAVRRQREWDEVVRVVLD